MALNDKTDQLVTKYVRRQFPELEDGIRRYIQDELQRIEQSISTLASTLLSKSQTQPTGQPSQRNGSLCSHRLGPTGRRFNRIVCLQRHCVGRSLISLTQRNIIMIGEIAGSLIGGYFGNKAAKHQAGAIATLPKCRWPRSV